MRDAAVTRTLRVTGFGFVAGAVFLRDNTRFDNSTAVPEQTAPILRWFRDLPWRLVKAELNRRGYRWEWLDR